MYPFSKPLLYKEHSTNLALLSYNIVGLTMGS